jgi:Rha family phage regulatory protein
MNDLAITKLNGGYYIDSREVAEIIGKRHDHLLRDIGKYREVIASGGLPKIGESDFFIKSVYLNAQNKEMPCYLLSKMGCEMVANKLTGDKGILFTAVYISKFNLMENAERNAVINAQSKPRLSEFNSAVKNVLSGMACCREKPARVMDFLRRVYTPLGIDIQTERDDMEYFSASQIARFAGIYSETGRPHGHAVAAIISKFDDWPEHTISIPYGLVGSAIRYDYHMVKRVSEWIEKNHYPLDIPYLDFFYHIYYDRHGQHVGQYSLFDFYIDLNIKSKRLK